MIGPWCNGNTSDFGSEIPGSNPGGPTIICPKLNLFIMKNRIGGDA